jgi:hypothetical protein
MRVSLPLLVGLLSVFLVIGVGIGYVGFKSFVSVNQAEVVVSHASPTPKIIQKETRSSVNDDIASASGTTSSDSKYEKDVVWNVDGSIRTVSMKDLSSQQQDIARTLGVEDRVVLLSEEIVSCAVSALGYQRMTELSQGATTTLGEGLTLLACVK